MVYGVASDRVSTAEVVKSGHRRIPRHSEHIKTLSLASLDTVAFVRGDFNADDYWSLIHHCRKGALDHGRLLPAPYYDVVYGPVAAFWNQRMIIADADQISFHTASAEAVLNSSSRRRII